MKLNFWQWIGIIVFGIALIFIIRRESFQGTPTSTQPPAISPATSPATTPAM
jgi:hypothetical protein